MPSFISVCKNIIASTPPKTHWDNFAWNKTIQDIHQKGEDNE